MKVGYFTLGIIFALIGLAGLAIPVFPSIPFFLLSLACFMKTSRRLEISIRRNRFYKKLSEQIKKISLKKYIPIGIVLCLFIALLAAVGIILYLNI